MQAMGSHRRGRMLFLGLASGLGSAMFVEGAIQPMELAHLSYKNGKTYEDYIGASERSETGPEACRGRSGRTKEKALMHCDDPLISPPLARNEVDIEFSVHRDRLAVEPCGLILPLTNSLCRCLP
jgi:hypothetical protein